MTPAAGASSVPAGGGSSLPFSGGSGKTPGRHHDRSARSSLDWDRPVSGNGLMSAASQEARSRAERRRWFAAASAAVERRQASASRWTRAAPPPLSSPRKRRRMQVGARRLDIRVCRRSAFLISCAGRDRDGCRSHRRRHPTGSGPELFVFPGAKLGCERAARTLRHCERQRSLSSGRPLRAGPIGSCAIKATACAGRMLEPCQQCLAG